ncbi:GTPase [Streptomyces iranensis]|uniref:ATP-binding protein SCC61A06c n=1 Tax=Streptomyces iranensis TaxID=576784 RepID=A0A060ZVG0_9ACTN|nr:GTPase [Streptomyces iranensis]MBP2065250.1 energy-coupling factor transporter ATP-binding protein EcfA2 [Streptomyces iranensis]CDR09791.1 ATP-binding protein SCC61A06c [Streptomyces iranensis]
MTATEGNGGNEDGGGGGGDRAAGGRHSWDDGLIARRAHRRAAGRAAHRPARAMDQGAVEAAAPDIPRAARGYFPEEEAGRRSFGGPPYAVYQAGVRSFATGTLRPRLEALRQLVGLSRSRLEGRTLAGAARVLDEADARGRHPYGHTVVAVAGATGSGKSTLFNALAGASLSETGIRRPTTATPLACAWTDHADGLLDRLGIPAVDRRNPGYPYDPALRGLVLLDLPDHDSAAPGHRERVDRLLGLVDAVVWVVDPEKYADAVLHERYLRPLAGYAEVTFVVLNQVDRLPGEAADQVLDDLRRLLDEDGLALGEHGEPGAAVLALSALTGEGVGELRETLARLTAECGAAERRLSADVDGTMTRLRPQYVADSGPVGLTERARAEFEDRLAEAAGAGAAGKAAERARLRDAEWACGTPWGRLRRRKGRASGGPQGGSRGSRAPGAGEWTEIPGARARTLAVEAVTARPAVEEAVRTLGDEATAGLPGPWAQAVREAAGWGGRGLAEAVDEAVAAETAHRRPVRPVWWSMVAAAQVTVLLVQVMGVLWLLGAMAGVFGGPEWWMPALLVLGGAVVGPTLAWGSRAAARGPARRHGRSVEGRLREAAAECGRRRVLEPVETELARYGEVRAQYVVAAGGA